MRSLAWLFTLLVMAAPAAWPANQPVQLKIFVSVLPIKTFVDTIGGERVETKAMVLPGHSPATYDPSPKQVAELAKADLYVRVGVPFESAWMERIQAANPEMPILDLRDGLPLRAQEAHDHEHGDGHGSDRRHDESNHSSTTPEMDPHIWTSPILVRKMAVAIRDRLSALDPAGAALYAQNQERFDAALVDLHQRIQASLTGLESRAFLVYHPAWGYFADTYGLEQVPIQRAGKEPGPRRLAALIEQAKATGTRAIFVQPEFDKRTAEQVARSIGGRVEVATPLAADYAANLQRFAAILADANSAADTSKPAHTSDQP